MALSRCVLLCAAVWCAAEASDVCERLFAKESLVCSTCDFIEKQQPELIDLVSNCRKCCGNDEVVSYSSATLVLDKRQRHWIPELNTFIEEKAEEFGTQLQIKYTYQSRPTLHMSQGGSVDKVPVGSWRADQISQYLKAKLAPKK
eukprot:TRINITY_DN78492_c0_g1_i1.p1 TRINITY_DN78492_c0_g1~~TRINITY_DN78492_c0_g1_i1.p1  ORF type:complete len:145 (+),score=57.96 TRINITY_DN78492_c0_g1_i1:41-475(+)